MINANLMDICFKLCSIDGVSGDEGRVREYLYNLLSPHVDEVKIGKLGSLMMLKKSNKPGQSLMLCAHMDEVGFIIKSITDEGFIKFATVGGLDRRILPGKRVRISSEKGVTYGVIGIGPTHLASENDKKKPPAIDDFYIDIGALSREDANNYVNIGDYIAFTTIPEYYSNGYFKAKAIDDRLGCAVMTKLLLENITPARDTWFVFTTREEVGGAGARTAAFELAPTEAMVLEGTTAADIPGVSGDKRTSILDKGVVISYMDNSVIYDPSTFRKLCLLADENKIAWQTKMKVAGGTDAGSIHVTRSGIPCAGLAAPVRYIHAPSSLVKISDCEAMLSLARIYLTSEDSHTQ